jgi:hypothetical protein
MHTRQNEQDDRDRANSRTKWVLAGFLAVAAYLLITEHQAHLSGVLNYLPYLLLLACPLMHVFHHGRHGNHGKHAGRHDGGDTGASASNRSPGEPN